MTSKERIAGLRELSQSGDPAASVDDRLRHQGVILELEHRELYAKRLIWVLVGELMFTNIVFVAYAWAGMHWRVPDTVVVGFLAAVVIEVIGLVFVITRNLFPNRDGPGSSSDR